MWIGILEAYNRTIDVVFRILDWMKGRPKKKLEDQRKDLEVESRQYQLEGNLDQLRRVRGEIQDIDRRLQSGDY